MHLRLYWLCLPWYVYTLYLGAAPTYDLFLKTHPFIALRYRPCLFCQLRVPSEYWRHYAQKMGKRYASGTNSTY